MVFQEKPFKSKVHQYRYTSTNLDFLEPTAPSRGESGKISKYQSRHFAEISQECDHSDSVDILDTGDLSRKMTQLRIGL